MQVGRKSRNLQAALAVAMVGGGCIGRTANLYDLEDVKYINTGDSSSGEFGAPFRGVEAHKRKKKGRK